MKPSVSNIIVSSGDSSFRREKVLSIFDVWKSFRGTQNSNAFNKEISEKLFRE